MSAHELIQKARSLRELIESEAETIEQKCTMTEPVVDAIEKTGLFQLITPAELGGLEADVDTVQAVCEEVSYADGAVGWAFTQNTITGGYLSYIEPEAARPYAALRAGAGHFAPLGVAHEEGDGYRISGNFQFASGSGHAQFMGGGALVMRDGEVAPVGEDGKLPVIGFFVPADRTSLKGGWDTMGLRGTGSFDYEVPEQFVHRDATWYQVHGYAPHKSGGPIFALGPVALGCIGSSSWAVGVAARALDEIAEVARAGRARMGQAALRDQTDFQRDYGFHLTAVKALRHLISASYGSAVDAIAHGAPHEECADLVHQTKAAASYVTLVAKQAVVFAWEASGSVGMRNPSRLQRCFRDIHVGAGHLVFDDRNYREAVKASLGLEPTPF
jgi:alkylation response protein AidB-like acyl-CoA dehydrogenase